MYASFFASWAARQIARCKANLLDPYDRNQSTQSDNGAI